MVVIKAEYNCKIDKIQKITVVVSAAGKIYTDTIQQETVRCEIQSVPVTARRLIKAMHENYCFKGGGNSEDNYKNSRNGNNNVDRHNAALIGADEPARQKCFTYGKIGRWARNCPKRQKKIIEKEFFLTEHVMSAAHMVIKRQIVGNFPKPCIQDSITGVKEKARKCGQCIG